MAVSKPDVFKHYEFVHDSVPSYDFNDQLALNRIKLQLPVILTGSNLVAPALKWDLEYLAEHLGSGPYSVFTNQGNSYIKSSRSVGSNSCPSENLPKKKINIFKYYDEKKMKEYKGNFIPEISRHEMSFQDFLDKYRGDRSKERVYLQQPLINTVGPRIASDFVSFNWSWTKDKQRDWNWGPLTSNLLLIGQEENVTPCHYDEQQNLFCQLKGKKQILLFHPDNFPCLYPYPVHHPHDRQSQVDLDNPDLQRFPKFCDVNGVQAIVKPGDILYIPMYWWHHVINLDDTIAINFWHKAGANSPDTPIEYPLLHHQKVAMVRNIEKMLLDALQDQDELKTILHWIVDGRF